MHLVDVDGVTSNVADRRGMAGMAGMARMARIARIADTGAVADKEPKADPILS